MSELEAMHLMLNRAGIEFSEKPSEKNPDVMCIIVERGYPGFWSELQFDEDGNLIDIGAWE